MTTRALRIYGSWLTVAALTHLAPNPAQARPRAKPASAEVLATAGLGMGVRDGAVLSTVDLRLLARRGRFSGGVQLPIQLQVMHARLGDQERFRGLRQRDWDQRSEWLRLLHHAAWRWRGKRDGAASVVIAPLTGATLGHGSVMRRYHATLRPDHYKAGGRARWDLGSWGGDLLVNDVTSASIAGGRLFFRPMGGRSLRRSPIARTLTFGATLVGHRDAPLSAVLSDGRQRYDPTGTLDARRGAVVIGGADLSMELVRSRTWSLVPYVDVNYSQLGPAAGMAAHLGARLGLWPGDANRTVGLRYELQTFDGAALPGYFDAMYEVEQDRWLGDGPVRPKAKAVALAPSGVARAHLVELSGRTRKAGWGVWLQLHDRPGRDVAAGWVDVRWSPRARARTTVQKRRFSGLSAALDEGQWTVAASARVQVVRPLELYVSLQRAWHAETGSGAGLRQTTDAIVGLSLTNAL